MQRLFLKMLRYQCTLLYSHILCYDNMERIKTIENCNKPHLKLPMDGEHDNITMNWCMSTVQPVIWSGKSKEQYQYEILYDNRASNSNKSCESKSSGTTTNSEFCWLMVNTYILSTNRRERGEKQQRCKSKKAQF